MIVQTATQRLFKQKINYSKNFDENLKYPLQSLKIGWVPNTIIVLFKNTGNRHYLKVLLSEGKNSQTTITETLPGGDFPCKFHRCQYPYLISILIDSKRNVEMLQVVDLEDTSQLIELELGEFKTSSLFSSSNGGIFLMSQTVIFRYPDLSNLKTREEIFLERKIPFLPNSLSCLNEDLSVITNGRKIIVINILDGRILFESKTTVVMPFLKLEYYKGFVFCVNVVQVCIFSIEDGKETCFEVSTSPTCCYATPSDYLIVGDSIGLLSVFTFTGEKLFTMQSPKIHKNLAEAPSLSDSVDCCVRSIGLYDNLIVSFSGNGVYLWELKQSYSPFRALNFDGKISSFRIFDNVIQLLMNDDELWHWMPNTDVELKDDERISFKGGVLSKKRSAGEYVRAKSSSTVIPKAMSPKKNSSIELRTKKCTNEGDKKSSSDSFSINLNKIPKQQQTGQTNRTLGTSSIPARSPNYRPPATSRKDLSQDKQFSGRFPSGDQSAVGGSGINNSSPAKTARNNGSRTLNPNKFNNTGRSATPNPSTRHLSQSPARSTTPATLPSSRGRIEEDPLDFNRTTVLFSSRTRDETPTRPPTRSSSLSASQDVATARPSSRPFSVYPSSITEATRSPMASSSSPTVTTTKSKTTDKKKKAQVPIKVSASAALRRRKTMGESDAEKPEIETLDNIKVNLAVKMFDEEGNKTTCKKPPQATRIKSPLMPPPHPQSEPQIKLNEKKDKKT